MAIDTKTTAGGVVLLFLSGSGSYLATNAVNGETTTPVTSIEDKQERSGNLGENQPTPTTDERQEEDTASREEVNENLTTGAETSSNEEDSIARGTAESADTERSPAPSEALNTAEQSQLPKPESASAPEAKKTTTIKEKIKEFSFSLIEEKETPDVEWEKLSGAIKTPKTTKDQLKDFCTTNLKATYTDENSEEFKNTAKKCTTLVTLKERANVLKINLIEHNNETSDWSKRFNDLTKEGAKKLADESSETITWDYTYNGLRTYCKQVEALNWTTITVTKDHNLEREWNNFLTGCAKETSLVRNFWTGK